MRQPKILSLQILILSSFLFFIEFSSHAVSETIDQTSCVIHKGGGGHEVPTPFGDGVNQAFEVADGQVYELIGNVEWPYFHVRVPNWIGKSYLLEGTQGRKIKREKGEIQLGCRAHGRIVFNQGVPEHRITLEPLYLAKSPSNEN